MRSVFVSKPVKLVLENRVLHYPPLFSSFHRDLVRVSSEIVFLFLVQKFHRNEFTSPQILFWKRQARRDKSDDGIRWSSIGRVFYMQHLK